VFYAVFEDLPRYCSDDSEHPRDSVHNSPRVFSGREARSALRAPLLTLR